MPELEGDMDGSFDLNLINDKKILCWLLEVATARIPARFRRRLEPADVVQDTLRKSPDQSASLVIGIARTNNS